jgi:hypothetical protein
MDNLPPEREEPLAREGAVRGVNRQRVGGDFMVIQRVFCLVLVLASVLS